MAPGERGRELRCRVLDCLIGPDSERVFKKLTRQIPARRLLRPLMSLIRSDDPKTKHRAAAALGQVTAKLAETDLEVARDVVRRLSLSLTEESGGIGWGSPESIGEILAQHEGLAQAYADIFLSYARVEEDVYLDHEPLQRGVLWGLARLAQAKPELLAKTDVMDCLRPHLRSNDATARALAAWTVTLSGTADDSCPEWKRILVDSDMVCVYIDDELTDCRVQDLARGSVRAT